jgi:hypothetical protein
MPVDASKLPKIKTYGGRTQAEQREWNKAKRERYRAKQEAKEAGIPFLEDVTVPADDGLELEVEAPVITKQSFRDRVMGRLNDIKESGKEKETDKKRIVKSEALIQSVLPTMLAGLIALYSRDLFRDPYKPCALTKAEVSSVLLPVFSIMHRHLEIEGKISQDMLDVASAFTAMIVITMRVLITKKEIDLNGSSPQEIRKEPPEARKDYPWAGPGNDTSFYPDDEIERSWKRNRAEEIIRDLDPDRGTDERDNEPVAGGWGRIVPDGEFVRRNGAPTALPDRDAEAALVARMLQRDTQGRRQMGAAPRIFREDDREPTD